MSQQVPMDRPLSDQDREYLQSRNMLGTIDMLDARYPADAGVESEEDDDEEAPYEEWTVADLQAELEERKLSKAGKKDELVARLRENDAANTE